MCLSFSFGVALGYCCEAGFNFCVVRGYRVSVRLCQGGIFGFEFGCLARHCITLGDGFNKGLRFCCVSCCCFSVRFCQGGVVDVLLFAFGG